jgi:hypothetical protein
MGIAGREESWNVFVAGVHRPLPYTHIQILPISNVLCLFHASATDHHVRLQQLDCDTLDTIKGKRFLWVLGCIFEAAQSWLYAVCD